MLPATDDSILEELPFERVSCKLERDLKVPDGIFGFASLQLKLRECRMVERILRKVVRVWNCTQLLQFPVGAIALPDGNCSI